MVADGSASVAVSEALRSGLVETVAVVDPLTSDFPSALASFYPARPVPTELGGLHRS